MPRILITGALGFTAQALQELISRDERCTIILTDILPDSSLSGYVPCDLSKPSDALRLIEKIQPDQIYHLAGAFTNDFKKDYKSNFLSTKSLLDSLLMTRKDTRVLLIGSAAEYGNLTNGLDGISEHQPLSPASIYGLTKVFQSQLMDYYCKNHDLNLVMVRPFNLIGKKISNKLFIGKLYEQILGYQQGKLSKIVVGNLDAERDYLDVHSAVADYHLIMKKGVIGNVYNVGSGQPRKIRDLLDQILKEECIDWSVVEETKYSSSSVKISFADISKISIIKAEET